MQRVPRKKKGFTIMEVMLAAFVMTFAIMTAITTMQRAFLSLDTARSITIAGQIMESEFEKMRMRDWTTVSAYTAGPTTMTIDPAFTSNSFIGNRFTLTRGVTSVVTGTGVGMKEVRLTVSWRTYDGRPLSRSYMSYYGQNGLYDYFYNSIY